MSAPPLTVIPANAGIQTSLERRDNFNNTSSPSVSTDEDQQGKGFAQTPR
ncbi:MAG: hypothetical protein KDA86_04500 [Planctomycetaceae bacterium]|nr:hypothetical protein [Planctomycetaceae bacterium]